MTASKPDGMNHEVPRKTTKQRPVAGRLVWWLCYAVAATVVVAMFIADDAWWMRGAIVLIAVISVIRFVHAERELREKFRGHCRACGYDVYVDDPWCPHCGGSVKELRRD